MKILCTIALCICLGLLCSASNVFIEDDIKTIKDDLQNKIHGVGKEFADDITTILDHTPRNPYFIQILSSTLVPTLGQITLKQNNTKFSVSDMNINLTHRDYSRSLKSLDKYKILQSTLSKEFPAERYNGIINMFYINVYPNATAEEIANTLNYLDGTDDVAKKVSYLDVHNFPNPVASDCPHVTRRYSEAVDDLKSMIDIKPKVFEDVASIREKFPCIAFVSRWLHSIVDELTGLQDDISKINACILEENSGTDPDQFKYLSAMVESIYSVRLSDESFRGLFNVIKATAPNTPRDEIEKALEYLYDDVPKADCSSESKARK